MPTLALIPHLVVDDAARAIEFYCNAFGAIERSRHADSSGRIVHADLDLGSSKLSLADESPDWNALGPKQRGGTSVVMTLEVDADVDALWARALDAGATVIYPLADQFYGARQGRVADPFGHQWRISMTTEYVSDAEIQRRMAAWEAANPPKG
ncbi:MAG: VOC family protein [Myxococcota bacterium]